MKYRKLGKTDLSVSVIGIGTWQFGGEWGKKYTSDEVGNILDTAKDLGINLIDTAECYGDHLSEQLIGEYLQHQVREKWVVATKFGHHYHGYLDRTEHWSSEEVAKQLEASLKALKTNYIDLYQFHSGTNEIFKDEALWRMLNKQVKLGKIRYLGISLKQQEDTYYYQTSHAGMVGASVIQVVYNRLERSAEENVLTLCKKENLGVMARVPLASGFLTGKYNEEAIFDKEDVRSRFDVAAIKEVIGQVKKIKKEEVPDEMTMSQWALAWCLKHPAVTCVIPGCKDASQVELNARVGDLTCVSSNHPLAVY